MFILLNIYIQQMLGTILQRSWFYMRKGSKRQDMGNLNKKSYTACTGTHIVKFMEMQSDGLQENMGSGYTLKPPAGVNQMRQRSMWSPADTYFDIAMERSTMLLRTVNRVFLWAIYTMAMLNNQRVLLCILTYILT